MRRDWRLRLCALIQQTAERIRCAERRQPLLQAHQEPACGSIAAWTFEAWVHRALPRHRSGWRTRNLRAEWNL